MYSMLPYYDPTEKMKYMEKTTQDHHQTLKKEKKFMKWKLSLNTENEDTDMNILWNGPAIQ